MSNMKSIIPVSQSNNLPDLSYTLPSISSSDITTIEPVYAPETAYANTLEPEEIYLDDAITTSQQEPTPLAPTTEFGEYMEEQKEYIEQVRIELQRSGFTETDVNRIINNEITMDELLTEMQNDENKDRLKAIYEASYMQSAINSKFGTDFISIADVETASAEITTELSELREEQKELEALSYVVEQLQNGKTLKDVENSTYKYLWTYPNGKTELKDSLPIWENLYTSTVTFRPVTYGEFLSSNEDYQNLCSMLTETTIDPLFGESYTALTWGNTEAQYEFLNDLQNTVELTNDKISENETTKATYDYIIETATREINHQINNIDPYLNQDDFSTNNYYNDNSSMLETITNTSNYSRGESENYFRNNTYSGIYIRQSGEGLTIEIDENQEALMAVLNAIINDDPSIVADESGLLLANDGTINIYARDDLLANMQEWKPLLTETEKQIFNYIYNTEGYKEAYNYLQDISNELDNRWLARKTQEDQEFASANPVIASVASVVVTPFEGMNAFLYSVTSLAENETIRRTNIYSMGDVYRQQVSTDIDAKYGHIASFWYNTGMSMADSAANIALIAATGGTAGGLISAATMGSRVYVSTLNDAKDRGLSDGDAVALAFSSALVESAMESYSAGHLLNMEQILASGAAPFVSRITSAISDPKTAKIASNVLYYAYGAVSQGLCEGEEEVSTEILNFVCDSLISEENSSFNQKISESLELGYSDEEALNMALTELSGQLQQAFLGGFASGVTFGMIGAGVSQTTNYTQRRNAAQTTATSILSDFSLGGTTSHTEVANTTTSQAEMYKSLQEQGKIPSTEPIATNQDTTSTITSDSTTQTDTRTNSAIEIATDNFKMNIDNNGNITDSNGNTMGISMDNTAASKVLESYNGDIDSKERATSFKVIQLETGESYGILRKNVSRHDTEGFTQKAEIINNLAENGVNTPKLIAEFSDGTYTYEIQELAPGKTIFGTVGNNYQNLLSSLEQLSQLSNLSEESYTKFIKDLVAIRESGLEIDHHAGNLLLDPETGQISFIDLDIANYQTSTEDVIIWNIDSLFRTIQQNYEYYTSYGLESNLPSINQTEAYLNTVKDKMINAYASYLTELNYTQEQINEITSRMREEIQTTINTNNSIDKTILSETKNKYNAALFNVNNAIEDIEYIAMAICNETGTTTPNIDEVLANLDESSKNIHGIEITKDDIIINQTEEGFTINLSENYLQRVYNACHQETIESINAEAQSRTQEISEVTSQENSQGVTAQHQDVETASPTQTVGTSDNSKTEIKETIEEAETLTSQSTTEAMIDIKKVILGTVSSFPAFFNKFRTESLSSNQALIERTMNEGLIHITTEDAASKIIESGYVKASGNALTSYGTPKAFFFSGIPNLGEVCLNLSTFQEKAVAVRIKPSIETLNDGTFSYRAHDDFAITHKGNFVFEDGSAEIIYLGLDVNEKGELYYKEISQEEYTNYTPNTYSITKNTSQIIKGLTDSIKGTLLGLSYQYDVLTQNIEKLRELSNQSQRSNNINKWQHSISTPLGRITKLGSGFTSMLTGFSLIMTTGPLGIAAGVPIAYKGMKLTQDGLTGNTIKNSILMTANTKVKTENGVEKVQQINQNIFTFNDFIKTRFVINHQEYFLIRSLNGFQQLKPNAKYTTNSQANTVSLLRQLQRLGFIKNLKYEKSSEPSNLGLERFALGVKKRKKPTTMYDISFETTDHVLTKEEVNQILAKYKIDTSKYKVMLDTNGNIIFDLIVLNSDKITKLKNKIKLVKANALSLLGNTNSNQTQSDTMPNSSDTTPETSTIKTQEPDTQTPSEVGNTSNPTVETMNLEGEVDSTSPTDSVAPITEESSNTSTSGIDNQTSDDTTVETVGLDSVVSDTATATSDTLLQTEMSLPSYSSFDHISLSDISLIEGDTVIIDGNQYYKEDVIQYLNQKEGLLKEIQAQQEIKEEYDKFLDELAVKYGVSKEAVEQFGNMILNNQQNYFNTNPLNLTDMIEYWMLELEFENKGFLVLKDYDAKLLELENLTTKLPSVKEIKDIINNLTNGYLEYSLSYLSKLDTDLREHLLNDANFRALILEQIMNVNNPWLSFRDNYYSIINQLSIEEIFLILNDLGDIDNLTGKQEGIIGRLYASMFEKNADKTWKCALNSDITFKTALQLTKYYYSNISINDYNLLVSVIKKINKINYNFGGYYTRLFSNTTQQQKILQEELPVSQIISLLEFVDVEVANEFSKNSNIGNSMWRQLSPEQIISLSNKGILFDYSVLSDPLFLEKLKTSSVIEFRSNIESIQKNNGFEVLEEQVLRYYDEIINSYDSETKIFSSLMPEDPSSITFSDKDLILNYEAKFALRDGTTSMQEYTAKKVREIVIDALFKDNYHNVRLNIEELLRYNSNLPEGQKIIDSNTELFYKAILNMESLSVDDMISIYRELRNVDISTKFYEDIRAAKDYAYDTINEELVSPEEHKELFSEELSNQYGVDIYDFRNQEYTGLVRVLSVPINPTTRRVQDCYTLINNHNNAVFGNGFIYGFSSFDTDYVIHMLETDAYTSDNKNANDSTETVNRIATSNQLVESNYMYSEINIANKLNDENQYETLKPDYILCKDKITERAISESKRLGIPIMLVTNVNGTSTDELGKVEQYIFNEVDYNRTTKNNPIEPWQYNATELNNAIINMKKNINGESTQNATSITRPV